MNLDRAASAACGLLWRSCCRASRCARARRRPARPCTFAPTATRPWWWRRACACRREVAEPTRVSADVRGRRVDQRVDRHPDLGLEGPRHRAARRDRPVGRSRVRGREPSRSPTATRPSPTTCRTACPGGFSYDFADNNATLALGLSGSTDTVGKAGDPEFSQPVGTLGGRLSFTQVLGPNTLGAARVRGLAREGLPGERRIATSRSAAACAPSAPPERRCRCWRRCACPRSSPDERLRHAVAVELRRALGESWSLDGGYRFYLDDWGVDVAHRSGRADVLLRRPGRSSRRATASTRRARPNTTARPTSCRSRSSRATRSFRR